MRADSDEMTEAIQMWTDAVPNGKALRALTTQQRKEYWEFGRMLVRAMLAFIDYMEEKTNDAIALRASRRKGNRRKDRIGGPGENHPRPDKLPGPREP